MLKQAVVDEVTSRVCGLFPENMRLQPGKRYSVHKVYVNEEQYERFLKTNAWNWLYRDGAIYSDNPSNKPVMDQWREFTRKLVDRYAHKYLDRDSTFPFIENTLEYRTKLSGGYFHNILWYRKQIDNPNTTYEELKSIQGAVGQYLINEGEQL